MRRGQGKRILTQEENGRRNDKDAAASAAVKPRRAAVRSHKGSDAPLSKREREVIAMLAGGASGAQIAERLVLSPETVRTHIRNAMAKLGASSRAQAVALAVQRQEIEWPAPASNHESARPGSAPAAPPGTPRSRAAMVATGQLDDTLTALLADLMSLYEVDGGMVFLTQENGFSLRRAALLGGPRADSRAPKSLQLGEGPIGRVALERRAQLVHGPDSREQTGDRATVCVPMAAAGTLVGVICLTIRPSRIVGRGELLLLQAFATRVAEILLSSEDHRQQRLRVALEGFRASWSSSGR